MTEHLMSLSEFVDKVNGHRLALTHALEAKLGAQGVERANGIREKVHATLGLGRASQPVVMFGEQTYGLNESTKVLGKRLLAKGLEPAGITTVEMFANFDSVGSEGGIYRMVLPNSQASDGRVIVSTLPHWSAYKMTPTAALPSPSGETKQKVEATLSTLYGKQRTKQVVSFMEHFYAANNDDYARAHILMLRSVDGQLGLGGRLCLTEEVVDTNLAQAGGMELMLDLWPEFVLHAKSVGAPGVRIPESNEAPFQLYHHNGRSNSNECCGRMQSVGRSAHVEMETLLTATCLQCGEEETLSPLQVLEQNRTLTWKAMPRVVLYSLTIADGHITGGGSIYNDPTRVALEKMGLNYFPLVHMAKQGSDGKARNIFRYESSSLLPEKRWSNKGYESARQLVSEGAVSIVDLLLSVDKEELKEAISLEISQGISPNSQIDCQTNHGRINLNEFYAI